MTNTLVANFDLSIAWKLTEDGDLSTPKDESVRRFLKTFTAGTGAGQVDLMWRDSRSVSASSTDSINLTTISATVLGDTRVINFDTVRGILLINTSTPTDSMITLGTGSSNGLQDLFGDADGKIRLGYGDAIGLTRQYAGITVDTSDKYIEVVNEDADAAATYDIVIVGTE